MPDTCGTGRRDFGIYGHTEFVATDGDQLTLRTAHRVGAFLMQVPPDAQIATRYARYMQTVSACM